MHHLKNKICPMSGKTCLIEGCAFFSEQLDDCKINMINYNLYASAAKIQALVDQINGVPESGPDSDYEPINSAKAGYARNPNRKKIIGTQKQWKFISGKGFPGPVKIFLFFLTGFY